MSENLDMQDIKRLLGFNIPGLSPKETLDFYKANFKKEHQKLMQDFTPYKPEELEKMVKAKPRSPPRIKEKVPGKHQLQSQISHMKLNEVENAFFLAYLRGGPQILSDADANKNKGTANMGDVDDENIITLRPEETVQIVQEVAQNPDGKEQGGCICGGKEDVNKLWFQCDGCQVWYHPECLGFTKEQISEIERQGESVLWFHSEECRENGKKAENQPEGNEGENSRNEMDEEKNP